MASIEMVEKLRERTGVTYEEAREALDMSQDDMLDALIWLEKNGKVIPPRVGRYSTDYWSAYGEDEQGAYNEESDARYYDSTKSKSESARRNKKVKEEKFDKKNGRHNKKSRVNAYSRHSGKNAYYYDERDSRGRASAFFKAAGRFFVKALHIGNTTMFEITRHERDVIKLPLTIMVVAFILFFKFLIIILPIGLFFGFRYRLSGENINEKPFNSAMDSASKTVDVIKDAFNKNGHK